MSKFRIIPTILTDGNRVLKGKNFDSSRPVGIIEPLINVYESRDVDELIILDTKATFENRTFNSNMIKSACEALSSPLSIGGGFSDVYQIEKALNHGADKVVLGTASLTKDGLVKKASSYFGSQCLIGCIDIRIMDTENIFIGSGGTKLKIDPVSAAIKLESLGIGEILIQIIDKEGTLSGISLDMASSILEKVHIPVVYSGGISGNQDFLNIAQRGFSGAAAGALFQFTEATPNLVREFLDQNNIAVRKAFKYTTVKA